MQSRSEEYEFPSWVPYEAIEFARDSVEGYVRTFLQIGGQFIMPRTKDDISSCQLRYVYEKFSVDYEKYDRDGDIRDLFKKLDSSDIAYGFGVFWGEKEIGSLTVGKDDDLWRVVHMSAYSEHRIPVLKKLFSRYSTAEGYKLYRDIIRPLYFVEIANKITMIAGIENGEYFESMPEPFLIKKKVAILEMRKHYDGLSKPPVPFKDG